MDLLGSILGKMDVPPCDQVDKETRKKVNDAKKRATKFKEDERKRKAQFRIEMEARINAFLCVPNEEKKMVFETMDKVHRSIAHDVAETAGLSSFAFGEEDIDRHLIVWKKEFTPSEEELDAIRKGEIYDPEKVAAGTTSVQDEEQIHNEKPASRKRTSTKSVENEKYFEKYAKIVGGESGLDAAKLTKSNKSYGMVPSKNKEDKRSIEETMKEIRERKKQRRDLEIP